MSTHLEDHMRRLAETEPCPAATLSSPAFHQGVADAQGDPPLDGATVRAIARQVKHQGGDAVAKTAADAYAAEMERIRDLGQRAHDARPPEGLPPGSAVETARRWYQAAGPGEDSGAA